MREMQVQNKGYHEQEGWLDQKIREEVKLGYCIKALRVKGIWVLRGYEVLSSVRRVEREKRGLWTFIWLSSM